MLFALLSPVSDEPVGSVGAAVAPRKAEDPRRGVQRGRHAYHPRREVEPQGRLEGHDLIDGVVELAEVPHDVGASDLQLVGDLVAEKPIEAALDGRCCP